MNGTGSTGKGPVRRLGRGLSALLGTPVQIQVEPQDESGQKPTPQAAGLPQASPLPLATAPVSMQTAVRPVEPLEGGPSTPREVAPGDSSAPISGEAHSVTVPATPPASHAGLREIPVEQIVPNRRQPRTDFDDAALQSLAASIRQAGLMQPIMVRPLSNGFELVAGERRWRAAKMIGLAKIPAVVKPIDDQTAAELALIENVQREDLNPMERAFALRRLASDFSLTHQQIAERVGLDRASVTNLLRLSDLDASTADLVRTGKLTQGHGKALLAVQDLGLRAEMASRALSREWSVRQLEREVQHINLDRAKPESASTVDSEPSAKQANVADLEKQLSEHLGTRVSVQLGRKKGSGRLLIDFFSLDQFDGLMDRMGFGKR